MSGERSPLKTQMITGVVKLSVLEQHGIDSKMDASSQVSITAAELGKLLSDTVAQTLDISDHYEYEIALPEETIK